VHLNRAQRRQNLLLPAAAAAEKVAQEQRRDARRAQDRAAAMQARMARENGELQRGSLAIALLAQVPQRTDTQTIHDKAIRFLDGLLDHSMTILTDPEPEPDFSDGDEDEEEDEDERAERNQA
jgi:hypothetical protein